MPSVSAKQHRFMEAVAHDPKFAAKVKVPQAVGQDFAAADRRKQVVAVMMAAHARDRMRGY